MQAYVVQWSFVLLRGGSACLDNVVDAVLGAPFHKDVAMENSVGCAGLVPVSDSVCICAVGAVQEELFIAGIL